MRLLFILIGLVSLSACAQPLPNELSPVQFDSVLRADTQVSLLDVRTDEEFGGGYIENAVNIDFYADDFTKQASALPKDKKILIYCLSGGRSAKAAAQLRESGYEVKELKGGMAAWRAASMPVEGGIAQVKQLDKSREKFLSELDSNVLYLVDFNAKWCLPCRQLLPIVERLDSLYADELVVKKVDFDTHRQLASDFQVEGLPYIMLIKNGIVVWTNFGLPTEEELKKAIESHR
ncbi:MAG: hypothetical protein EP332_02195 [Bacteroidetes bacterium]|nr:MAG: hypothetical protein EP332_02195 [Bacteroidota bacterium]